MTTNLDRFKTDLTKLLSLGDDMWWGMALRSKSDDELDAKEKVAKEKFRHHFERNYQNWYSQAYAVLKQIMPDRLSEFSYLYHGDGKRKQINTETYHIQDWLNGIRAAVNLASQEKIYDDFAVTFNRFSIQRDILSSAKSRFESSLFDIAQFVRADLFDSELASARELAKHGFLRGAGAIAGVVIEKHLGQVCASHLVVLKKKEPAINDFNEALKGAAVLDVPMWRQIQRLGDIRNLCDHNKHREPTKEEVVELIDGTEKLCKTIF